MQYFWEVFWGAMFVVAGAVIASLFSWIWWGGALIGLGVYLIALIAIKGNLVGEFFEGIMDGILG